MPLSAAKTRTNKQERKRDFPQHGVNTPEAQSASLLNTPVTARGDQHQDRPRVIPTPSEMNNKDEAAVVRVNLPSPRAVPVPSTKTDSFSRKWQMSCNSESDKWVSTWSVTRGEFKQVHLPTFSPRSSRQCTHSSHATKDLVIYSFIHFRLKSRHPPSLNEQRRQRMLFSNWVIFFSSYFYAGRKPPLKKHLCSISFHTKKVFHL